MRYTALIYESGTEIEIRDAIPRNLGRRLRDRLARGRSSRSTPPLRRRDPASCDRHHDIRPNPAVSRHRQTRSPTATSDETAGATLPERMRSKNPPGTPRRWRVPPAPKGIQRSVSSRPARSNEYWTDHTSAERRRASNCIPLGRRRVLPICPSCVAARPAQPRIRAHNRSRALGEVHFLCRACSRCWQLELGCVRRVAPTTCFGCTQPDRCSAASRDTASDLKERSCRSQSKTPGRSDGCARRPSSATRQLLPSGIGRRGTRARAQRAAFALAFHSLGDLRGLTHRGSSIGHDRPE